MQRWRFDVSLPRRKDDFKKLEMTFLEMTFDVTLTALDLHCYLS